MIIAKPLKNTSVFDKDNEGVVLSNQNDAFVFLRPAIRVREFQQTHPPNLFDKYLIESNRVY